MFIKHQSPGRQTITNAYKTPININKCNLHVHIQTRTCRNTRYNETCKLD